jgi:hypothetical protein
MVIQTIQGAHMFLASTLAWLRFCVTRASGMTVAFANRSISTSCYVGQPHPGPVRRASHASHDALEHSTCQRSHNLPSRRLWAVAEMARTPNGRKIVHNRRSHGCGKVPITQPSGVRVAPDSG